MLLVRRDVACEGAELPPKETLERGEAVATRGLPPCIAVGRGGGGAAIAVDKKAVVVATGVPVSKEDG